MLYILLALLVVPVVEIYVLLQVGGQIGVLPTVGLLIGVSVLGTWLIRREGARTWSAFGAAMNSGRIPAREVADGALVMFGGALLLTPGFVTDLVGLLCIVPPTRALLRRALLAQVARRAVGGQGRGGQSWGGRGWGRSAGMPTSPPPATMWVPSDRTDRRPGTPSSGPVIDGELDSGGDAPRT